MASTKILLVAGGAREGALSFKLAKAAAAAALRAAGAEVTLLDPRALGLMRQFLGLTIDMLSLLQQFALGRAGEALGSDGALVEAKAQQTVDGIAAALLRISNALRTP